MTSGKLIYRLSAIFLAALALLLSSGQPVRADTFVSPSAIVIDGTFTDWPASPPPNPGCYVIQDFSNTGIYDGTGFSNTPADINYFWNAMSTQNGGTDNASAANKIQNIYYRIDTFTNKVISPQQTYNIQLNLGTAAEGYADHLLQISVLDTATPKVRILLSQYNAPYYRMGAYTSGSLTSRVCNIAGYGGVVDARAVGAYGKYNGTNYGIEVSIPIDWYGAAYGGTVKDDGTGARLIPLTLFTSTGSLGSVGTVKDTINDAMGELHFAIVNAITGETTYVFPPSLTVTKQGPDEATVGSYITFTGTLSNVGYIRAENVVMVDYLPAGLNFVSSSHSAVYDPVAHAVTWNLGSVGGLTAMPGWLTVQVDGSVPNGTLLTNTFSITWKDEIGTGYGPTTATKDVMIYTHPTLSISKSGPATGSPGGPLSFSINVTNSGGLPAQNVTLVDTLPADYTYVSSSSSGVYDPGTRTVTWNLGSLAAGGNGIVSLTVQVDAGVANNTPLDNIAEATWQDAGGTTYGPVGSTLTTTIYTTPQLIVTKEGPDEATAGSYITFTGTITNAGGTEATDAVLIDYLPEGLTFVSSSHSAVYDPIARTVTWNLGSIPSGISLPGWITVLVDDSVYQGSHLVNTFSTTWKDTGGTSYGPSTAGKEFIVYTRPVLSINKTGPATGSPGDRLTFTIDVTNSGEMTAYNVSLMDILADNYTYISSNPPGTYMGGNVVWNLGTLNAGGTASVSLTIEVDAGVANGTPLANGAMVTWQDGSGNSYGPSSSLLATTIYTSPQLTVTKEGPDEATIGSYITFHGSTTNSGGSTAENVVLVDYLPVGLTYISSSSSAVYDPIARTVTWSLGSIEGGASMNGWITVQVDSSVANGSHRINDLAVTWQDGFGNNYGPASATKEVVCYTHPTLSITKSGPTTGTPGGRLTFTIDVTNSGGLSAYNVTLVDALPDKYTYVSSNPPGTYAGGNVVWDLGTLNAGGTASLSLTVEVDASVANGTPLYNSAMVTWENGSGNSYGPAGSSLTTIIYTTPQLTVTKEGPDEATVGSYITFNGSITNIGGTTAENIVLVDYLPEGLIFISATHSAVYDPVARTVTSNIGSLASGNTSSGVFTVQVDGSVANGSRRINAYAATWQDVSGNSYGPASATKEVVCYTHPTLSISKSGPTTGTPGGRLTFTIDVTNSGGLPAQNVSLIDMLSDKYSYVSSNPPGALIGGNVVWDLGTLNAGGTASLSLTVEVDAGVANGTPLYNSAMVTWQDGSGNSYGPTTSSLTTTIYTTPQLTVTKEGPAEATVGSYITFTGTITNTGGSTAENAVLVDYLPAGLIFVGSSHSAVYDPVAHTVTWNLGSIASGVSLPGWITVQVDGSVINGSRRINDFSITWQDGSGNSYGPAGATKEVTCYTHPTLSITKSGPTIGSPGGRLTFTIDVTNSGGLSAYNVTLVDALPDKYAYVSSDPPGALIGGNVVWNLGTLNAGGNASVSVTVEVDAGVANDTPLANGAMVTWKDGSDNNYGPHTSSLTTTIYTTPQLTVTKTGPATASPGDQCTYTITLNNSSGSSALDIELKDYVPAGMIYVSSSDGGVYAGGIVTWNLGTIASQASRTVTVTLQVDPAMTEQTVLVDEVAATWEDGLGSGYGPAGGSFTTTAYLFPVLSIAVSGPASGQCGTNLVFTLSVTNNSSSVAAGNVIAQYILPSSCDYVGSSDGGAYAGGIVTWNLGSLAPAGTRQVTVTISCCRAPGGSELISTGAVVWQYPAGTMHGPAFGNARTHIQAPPAPAPPQAPEAVAPPAHQGVTSHSSTVSDTHSWTWDNNAVNLSNIVVQSASLSSSKAEPGASVTVSAVVANKGTVNGSTRITVYVNGEKDQSYGVSVNSGKSTRLQFAISREMPGTYSVYVNGVSAGSFSVSDNLGNNIVLMLSSLCLLTALFLGILMTLRRRQNPY